MYIAIYRHNNRPNTTAACSTKSPMSAVEALKKRVYGFDHNKVTVYKTVGKAMRYRCALK